MDDDLSKLTVVQLKTELQKRGLDQVGRKQDLIIRLLENDAGRHSGYSRQKNSYAGQGLSYSFTLVTLLWKIMMLF